MWGAYSEPEKIPPLMSHLGDYLLGTRERRLWRGACSPGPLGKGVLRPLGFLESLVRQAACMGRLPEIIGANVSILDQPAASEWIYGTLKVTGSH